MLFNALCLANWGGLSDVAGRGPRIFGESYWKNNHFLDILSGRWKPVTDGVSSRSVNVRTIFGPKFPALLPAIYNRRSLLQNPLQNQSQGSPFSQPQETLILEPALSVSIPHHPDLPHACRSLISQNAELL